MLLETPGDYYHSVASCHKQGLADSCGEAKQHQAGLILVLFAAPWAVGDSAAARTGLSPSLSIIPVTWCRHALLAASKCQQAFGLVVGFAFDFNSL